VKISIIEGKSDRKKNTAIFGKPQWKKKKGRSISWSREKNGKRGKIHHSQDAKNYREEKKDEQEGEWDSHARWQQRPTSAGGGKGLSERARKRLARKEKTRGMEQTLHGGKNRTTNELSAKKMVHSQPEVEGVLSTCSKVGTHPDLLKKKGKKSPSNKNVPNQMGGPKAPF